ncbi:MAG: hypothetical protein K2Y37_22930 [Pirellulales bacterium]|nr:hypothetical protein [Pirellulales bacterium]
MKFEPNRRPETRCRVRELSSFSAKFSQLPLDAPAGRWRQRRRTEKQTLLKLEFRTFVNHWLRIPCQVLRSGRKVILRLLAYHDWQPVFFRLAGQLRHPLRC